jgi:hypothetical protein
MNSIYHGNEGASSLVMDHLCRHLKITKNPFSTYVQYLCACGKFR